MSLLLTEGDYSTLALLPEPRISTKQGKRENGSTKPGQWNDDYAERLTHTWLEGQVQQTWPRWQEIKIEQLSQKCVPFNPRCRDTSFPNPRKRDLKQSEVGFWKGSNRCRSPQLAWLNCVVEQSMRGYSTGSMPFKKLLGSCATTINIDSLSQWPNPRAWRKGHIEWGKWANKSYTECLSLKTRPRVYLGGKTPVA